MWFPTFGAKTPEAAHRAQIRRLVRWRKRVWRHLAAIPIGTLLGAAGAAFCHVWGEHYSVLCGLFSKLMGH